VASAAVAAQNKLPDSGTLYVRGRSGGVILAWSDGAVLVLAFGVEEMKIESKVAGLVRRLLLLQSGSPER
jgi:uncharacterized membrane protein (UPF0136 family)